MMKGHISIEKGKYTALLRRVLGMQWSENGVSEVEAILNIISTTGDNARRAYHCGATQAEIDDNIQNIEFAIEYYRICNLGVPETFEAEPQSNSPAF